MPDRVLGWLLEALVGVRVEAVLGAGLGLGLAVLWALRRRGRRPSARLRSLSPREFEGLVAELFRRLGFREVRVVGGSGDGGVDLVARWAGRTVLVQCKRYSRPVPVSAVREFYGVLRQRRASHGYLVATAPFTRPARRFASSAEVAPVLTLWDHRTLLRLLRRHRLYPFGPRP